MSKNKKLDATIIAAVGGGIFSYGFLLLLAAISEKFTGYFNRADYLIIMNALIAIGVFLQWRAYRIMPEEEP